MRKSSNSEIPPLWSASMKNLSKDTYEAKIHNIQEYGPLSDKKWGFSGDISKFLPVQWDNLL